MGESRFQTGRAICSIMVCSASAIAARTVADEIGPDRSLPRRQAQKPTSWIMYG